MKTNSIKKYLERLLAWFARKILKKYQPDIIAVTGSVGKTSAKEAIFTTLIGSFAVRKSPGNHNNEFGLPLAILDENSGGKNPFAWLGIFFRATRLLLKTRPYPEMLVLEMAADHPGDLAYLTGIARPRVSVTTAVAQVHTEFLGSVEDVTKEKSTLAKETEEGGYAVLNADDERVIKFAALTKARVLSYGLTKKADVRASDISFLYGKQEAYEAFPRIVGMQFQLHFDGKSQEVSIKGVVGQPVISSALAGAALGFIYGQDIRDIAESFSHFIPPRGRTRVLKGQKNSLLIDDSYNASPRAVLAALNLLSELSRDLRHHFTEGPVEKTDTIESVTYFRRIAVLGDMAELGDYTDQGHEEVGQAANDKVDLLLTVGNLAKGIAQSAREAGFDDEQIQEFSNAKKAAEWLMNNIGVHDVILVKGSQSVRLERVVRSLLIDPEQAEELLVRQGREWK